MNMKSFLHSTTHIEQLFPTPYAFTTPAQRRGFFSSFSHTVTYGISPYERLVIFSRESTTTLPHPCFMPPSLRTPTNHHFPAGITIERGFPEEGRFNIRWGR